MTEAVARWCRTVGLALSVGCALGPLCGQAAEPPQPDRAVQILEMQLQSRTTRPPPPSMSGREASRIYEGAFGTGSHDASAPTNAPAAAATGQ